MWLHIRDVRTGSKYVWTNFLNINVLVNLLTSFKSVINWYCWATDCYIVDAIPVCLIVGCRRVNRPYVRLLESTIFRQFIIRRLSVSPLVCLSHAWERKGVCMNMGSKSVGGKEAHDTADPWSHLEVESCRVRKILAPHRLCVWQGRQCPMSKWKNLGGCSSHHMQRKGA